MIETKEFVRNLRESIRKPQCESVKIKQPPIEDKVESFDWISGGIQCFVSVLSFSVVSFILLKDINTTLLCAVISAIGTFLSAIATYFVKKERVNKLNIYNKELYCKYLNRIKQKVEDEVAILNEFYNLNYPDIETCVKIVVNCSTQLWDRSLLNRDFLLLNLGKVNSKELNIITPECEEDTVYKEQISIIKNKEYMEIPRLIDIKNTIIGIIGEEKYINSVINNLFIDMYAHHSYNEVKVIWLDVNNYCDDLLHLNYSYNFSEKVNLVGKEKIEIEKIIIWLKKLLKNRHNSLLNDNESALPFPFYILFVSKNILNKEDELLFCRYAKENISFSVFFLYQYLGLLPELTDKIIECKENKILIHNNINNPLSCIYLNMAKKIIDLFIEKIDQIHPIEDDGIYQLPPQISIYDGYHIRNVNDLKIIDYWNSNENLNTLKVPIGVDGNGKTFFLDISENIRGHHGLIAGTTGSGKSELIITIVLSMAINYSPKKINFVLIDFKGGGLAGYLGHLPHVTKVITNLEEKIENELEYLIDELKRRHYILSQKGVTHINTYNEKYPEEKMPALMIIVDEIAELKVEFPQFMKNILRIAQIGGSLGIHLLLSTQLPLGIIDDEIFANSKYRFCFRVNSELESQNVIKSSVASRIQYPGRGYLQIGNSAPKILQIFWSEKLDDNVIYGYSQADRIVEYIRNLTR